MLKMAAVEEEVREQSEEGSVLLSEEERWVEVAAGVLLVTRRCSLRGWPLERQCSEKGCWLKRTVGAEEEAANVLEPVVVGARLLEAVGEALGEVTEHQMRVEEERMWVVEVELKEAPKSGWPLKACASPEGEVVSYRLEAEVALTMPNLRSS